MTQKATTLAEGPGAVAALVAVAYQPATLTLFDGDTVIYRADFPRAGKLEVGGNGCPYPVVMFSERLRVNLRAGFSKYGRLLPTDEVKVEFAALSDREPTR